MEIGWDVILPRHGAPAGQSMEAAHCALLPQCWCLGARWCGADAGPRDSERGGEFGGLVRPATCRGGGVNGILSAGSFLSCCWPGELLAAAGTKKCGCHKCEPEGVGGVSESLGPRADPRSVCHPSRFAAVSRAA